MMMHVYKLDERDGCLGFTFLFFYFVSSHKYGKLGDHEKLMIVFLCVRSVIDFNDLIRYA